jgi:hypothetical protein
MPRTVEDKFRAARYRHRFLRHSIEHFDNENHQIRFNQRRQQHPEEFQRVRIVPFPMQKGITPISWLRRDRA